MLLITAFAFTLAAPAPASQAGASVPFPHPLITEVLFAVPGGRAGDANGDGERQPLGDEFIELINPHDRPISLKGYTLVDADAHSPGAPKPDGQGKPKRDENRNAEVRFTFPDCELKPGQIVLVFNGYKSSFSEPPGDQTRAPSGPSTRFHGAIVFSMSNASPYAAFGNDGDFVLLSAPDGAPVHGIKWGKTDKNLPSNTLLSEEAPIASGSVQRPALTARPIPHSDLGGDFKGSPFSPGLFRPVPVDAKANPAPAGAPAGTNPTPPRNTPGAKPRK